MTFVRLCVMFRAFGTYYAQSSLSVVMWIWVRKRNWPHVSHTIFPFKLSLEIYYMAWYRTLTTHDCNGLSINVSVERGERFSTRLLISLSTMHYTTQHILQSRILKWQPRWMSSSWNCFPDDHKKYITQSTRYNESDLVGREKIIKRGQIARGSF